MKTRAVLYRTNGLPLEVAELDTLELGPPGPDEAIVQVEAAPIHVADLLYMQGLLPSLAPPAPAVAGIEGVGRIVELGPGVRDYAVGQRVFLPRRSGTFSQFMRVAVAKLVRCIDEGDPVQLSLLPINGATSYVMLTRVLSLSRGEWIVQNAANSSCGRFVIGIAKQLGLRTINVVRRPELVDDLHALGADSVLLDGADLAMRVAKVTGDAPIRFGIDAVAGTATQRIAECLAVGGTMVSYGRMSEQPCTVAAELLFTRNLTLRGFCTPFFETDVTPGENAQMMLTLSKWSAQGALRAAIAATYPLAQFRDAIRHESMTGTQREGKVVILPNA